MKPKSKKSHIKKLEIYAKEKQAWTTERMLQQEEIREKTKEVVGIQAKYNSLALLQTQCNDQLKEMELKNEKMAVQITEQQFEIEKQRNKIQNLEEELHTLRKDRRELIEEKNAFENGTAQTIDTLGTLKKLSGGINNDSGAENYVGPHLTDKPQTQMLKFRPDD